MTQPDPQGARRASYLLLTDFERLEAWCKDVRLLCGGYSPYLVGSVNERPDFRDVDLRIILPDAVFDRWWSDPVRLRTLNHALSTWGQRETGLPIDCQVQRQTEASEQFGKKFRNPMGDRDWTRIVPAGVLVEAEPMTQPDPQGALRITARERLIYRVRAVNARLRDKTGSDIDPAIWLDDLDAIEAEAIAANNAALRQKVLSLGMFEGCGGMGCTEERNDELAAVLDLLVPTVTTYPLSPSGDR